MLTNSQLLEEQQAAAFSAIAQHGNYLAQYCGLASIGGLNARTYQPSEVEQMRQEVKEWLKDWDK